MSVPSDAMEDYLKAIYALQSESGPPVSTSDIAAYLDKTAPTVTSMTEKLTDRGFLDREKYSGVELTAEGETVALEVIRHHRLLESYLATHLDYDWSEVHDEADRLEHHISEEFERRVAAALDEPEVDPHGDPIPSADLEPVEESDADPLSAFDIGDTVAVERVSDRDETELEYLADAGIVPGTELTVVDVAPFGMMTVDIANSAEQSLPESIAASIHVRTVGSGDGDAGRDADGDAGGDPDGDAGRDPDGDAGRDPDGDAGRDPDGDAGRDVGPVEGVNGA